LIGSCERFSADEAFSSVLSLRERANDDNSLSSWRKERKTTRRPKPTRPSQPSPNQ
jgi:hypothetical protein